MTTTIPSDTHVFFQTLEAEFDQVAMINRLAGNHKNPVPATVKHQAQSIIKSETLELHKGLIEDDAHEIRDGVADVLFTVAGMFARLGFNTSCLFAFPREGTNYLPKTILSYSESLTHYCDAMTALSLADHQYNSPNIYDILKIMADRAIVIGTSFGYPVRQDLQTVIDSNMSKFDRTEGDAIATVQKYAKLGVKTKYHKVDTESGPYFVCLVKEYNPRAEDGKEYPEGKWVKSCNFREPAYVW